MDKVYDFIVNNVICQCQDWVACFF